MANLHQARLMRCCSTSSPSYRSHVYCTKHYLYFPNQQKPKSHSQKQYIFELSSSNTWRTSHSCIFRFIGHLVFLADETGKSHLLSFSSRKTRRIVASSFSWEALALNRAFDDAIIFRHYLRDIFHEELPIMMYIDNLGLFDAVTKNTATTEQRLLIDLAVLNQSWARK
jgi:hypothetical protein